MAKDGEIKLRIVLDRFSPEAFVNAGEQAASAVICTRQEADGAAPGNALFVANPGGAPCNALAMLRKIYRFKKRG